MEHNPPNTPSFHSQSHSYLDAFPYTESNLPLNSELNPHSWDSLQIATMQDKNDEFGPRVRRSLIEQAPQKNSDTPVSETGKGQAANNLLSI